MKRDKRKKLNEAEENATLRKSIARLSVILGTRATTASKDRLPKINTALLLLNQAQSVVGANSREASKLVALARRIKASGDVKSESKKKREKLYKEINEHRTKLRIVKSING